MPRKKSLFVAITHPFQTALWSRRAIDARIWKKKALREIGLVRRFLVFAGVRSLADYYHVPPRFRGLV